MRNLRLLLAGVLALGAMACSGALDVTNDNSPDGQRALNRPSDVEALIGSSYQAVHASTLGGSNDNIINQTRVMGMENHSNLANFGMALRSAIPGNPIDNSRGNAVLTGNYRDWLGLHRAARQAATGLARVNDPNFTFFPASAAQKARARAMGYFVIGTALGDVALIYDQGSRVSPNDAAGHPPLPLVPYDSLMAYALAQLDTAIAIAGAAAPSGANGFPTPSSWFNGLTLTSAQFVGLARGYKALLRAGMARTPAERAAVDWNAVIGDATAFTAQFPSDFAPLMTPSVGWDISWFVQHFASASANWHMMSQFMIAMADTSGAYVTWLNSSLKTPFLIVTPDRRFPAGDTRATQRAVAVGGTTLPAGVYLRNRSVSDWAGDPLSNSWYDHYRWFPFYSASRIGNFPVITTAEIDMLAAEGYIRTNQFDQAAILINKTRVARGGLPALPAGMAATTQVPGGNACVPRVPSLSGSTYTVACGTIMEAMKWEKRMEGAYTSAYGWYIDSRGWGDLPQGTALMWPTPYQEIDTRQLVSPPPPYVSGYGGVGGVNAAVKGTYGL